MRLAALPTHRTRYRDRGETSAFGTHRSETHKNDPHRRRFSAITKRKAFPASESTP